MQQKKTLRNVTIQHAKERCGNKYELWDGLRREGFYVPEYKASIITVKYLMRVKNGLYYVPAYDELHVKPCQQRIERRRLLEAVITNAKALKKNVGIKLGSNEPDTKWLVTVLGMLCPHHIFFDKSYYHDRCRRLEELSDEELYLQDERDEDLVNGLLPVLGKYKAKRRRNYFVSEEQVEKRNIQKQVKRMDKQQKKLEAMQQKLHKMHQKHKAYTQLSDVEEASSEQEAEEDDRRQNDAGVDEQPASHRQESSVSSITQENGAKHLHIQEEVQHDKGGDLKMGKKVEIEDSGSVQNVVAQNQRFQQVGLTVPFKKKADDSASVRPDKIKVNKKRKLEYVQDDLFDKPPQTTAKLKKLKLIGVQPPFRTGTSKIQKPKFDTSKLFPGNKNHSRRLPSSPEKEKRKTPRKTPIQVLRERIGEVLQDRGLSAARLALGQLKLSSAGKSPKFDFSQLKYAEEESIRTGRKGIQNDKKNAQTVKQKRDGGQS